MSDIKKDEYIENGVKIKQSAKIQRGNTVTAFKAGFWYVCGNFIGKAITFITTPIFARLMTPSDYGELYNFELLSLK